MQSKQERAIQIALHSNARKNWKNMSLKEKKEYHIKTTKPTNQTHPTTYRGKYLGNLPIRIGGDGNANGTYHYVHLPDGSSMNLDISLIPKYQKCWKCHKGYNAHTSNGVCPHCGIDV